MPEPPRRFPAPWHVDKIPGGYVIRDANGQALTYLYSRDNATEALQAKMLTKGEARRIAINIGPAAGAAREGRARLRKGQGPRRYLGLKLNRLGLPAARAGSSQDGHWFKARKRSKKSSVQASGIPARNSRFPSTIGRSSGPPIS
jgi:hypothetical protein